MGLGEALFDIHREAFRLGPKPKNFGVNEESIVCSTESDHLIYTVAFDDPRMEERGCSGLCQRKGNFEKGHIEQDLSQMSIDEESPAEDFIVSMQVMDIHELSHWADEHHDDNENYESEGHSPRWNTFIVRQVLSS